MSWPTPAVVLQALNSAAVPDSTRRLRRIIVKLLRMGNSLIIQRIIAGSEDRFVVSKVCGAGQSKIDSSETTQPDVFAPLHEALSPETYASSGRSRQFE
jgi:hypothetical protein